MGTNRAAKVDSIIAILKEGSLEEHDESHLNPEVLAKWEATLASFSDDLIDSVGRVLTDDLVLASEVISLIATHNTGTAVHEHLVFRPFMSDGTDTASSRMILRPLHEYILLPQADNYATCNSSITEQVAALVTVTERLYLIDDLSRYTGDDVSWLPLSYVRGGVVLAGDDLVQLVLDHPQDAERIKNIIVERHTGDAELIRSILTNSTPAVSEGTI